MLDVIIYIIIGAAAGILSGLFGIGGGIIIIPALMYLKGFSQLTAQGHLLLQCFHLLDYLHSWNIIRKVIQI
ncbi:putative membrane protein YfcA [Clostridium beijerinckii]|nr:putative membrane protein YfcA [Clostridium beijerinckii]